MRVEPNQSTEAESDTLTGKARRQWNEYVSYAKTPAADKPRYSLIGFDVTLFDLVGDHNAAIILHEILFWFTPNGSGKSHKEGGIYRDGQWYIARSYEDWWESKRLSKTQVTTALNKLIKLGFITTKIMKSPYHNMNTTKCIHLKRDVFANAWHKLPKPEVTKGQIEKVPSGISESDKSSLSDTTNVAVSINKSNIQNEPTEQPPKISVSLADLMESVTERPANTHLKPAEIYQEETTSEAPKSETPETQPSASVTTTSPPAEESDEIETMSGALRAHTATKAQNRTPDLHSAGRRLLQRGFLPEDIEGLERVIRQRMFGYKKGVPDPLTIEQLMGYIETHDQRPGQTATPDEKAMLKDFDLG